MLKATEFSVYYNPGLMFIEQITKEMSDPENVKYYAFFLLEFSNYESDWINARSPIYQGAACYSLSKYSLREGISPWPKKLSEIFDIQVSDFLEELCWVFQEYASYKLNKENVIYQRYSQSEFQNVSDIPSKSTLNYCYKTKELYFDDDIRHVAPCQCQLPI